MKNALIIMCLCLSWWIARTECLDGTLYNVWTNGRVRYWLPALTTSGSTKPCGSCTARR